MADVFVLFGIIQMQDGGKMNLEAINILKGIAYSQLQLEDERVKLITTSNLPVEDIFRQIDRRMTGQATPQDLVNFLGVHRIAANERECQYVIWLSGSKQPALTFDQFIYYITNGRPDQLPSMQNSGLGTSLLQADELLRNTGEREVALLLEKEIGYYRQIEQLRQSFVKQYGMQFNTVIKRMEGQERGVVSLNSLVSFIQGHGVEFSREQFEAVSRKVRAKDDRNLTHKELMRAFAPFEPMDFPTYRKQGNLQRAIEHINQQVKLLQIDTYAPPNEPTQQSHTRTGFQKIVDEYRNPVTQGNHLTSKFFYDKNYYNELRQYRATFFEPNKEVRRRVQGETIGPQYHDHFFADYYLYLQQRNQTEHYYNKFGKRYAYQNPISKTLGSKDPHQRTGMATR